MLEQYPTSPSLAASIVNLAVQRQDLGVGRTALDLGCGTGMLAIACAVVDCDHVLGVDCDAQALAVAQENVANMELQLQVDLLLAKLNDQGFVASSGTNHSGGRKGRAGRGGKQKPQLDSEAPDLLPLQSNCVDTVLVNPPFGTKHNPGMDVRFLKAATRLAKHAVYSFHKTSTRPFLLKKIQREWNLTVEVVAEMKFDIPNTYKFHEKKNVAIDVDLLRISMKNH